MVRWARWWVYMWFVNAIALTVLVFVLPFRLWTVAAIVGFGIPEAVGIHRKKDPFPPLTHVMRRYLPRWIAYTLVYGFWGGVVSYWLGFAHPERLAALTGLLGWLDQHFEEVYDRPPE